MVLVFYKAKGFGSKIFFRIEIKFRASSLIWLDVLDGLLRALVLYSGLVFYFGSAALASATSLKPLSAVFASSPSGSCL